MKETWNIWILVDLIEFETMVLFCYLEPLFYFAI